MYFLWHNLVNKLITFAGKPQSSALIQYREVPAIPISGFCVILCSFPSSNKVFSGVVGGLWDDVPARRGRGRAAGDQVSARRAPHLRRFRDFNDLPSTGNLPSIFTLS